MNTQRYLILAGVLATQLCAVAPAFAQGHAERVTLEHVVVVGKKTTAAPIPLEAVVVVGHRSQVVSPEHLARVNNRVGTAT